MAIGVLDTDHGTKRGMPLINICDFNECRIFIRLEIEFWFRKFRSF